MLETVCHGDYDKAIMDICRTTTTDKLTHLNLVEEVLSRTSQYKSERLAKMKATEQQEQIERWKKEAEADPVPPEKVKEFLDNFYEKLGGV